MASAAMQALKNRRKLQIEAREKDAEKEVEISEEVKDDNIDKEPDSQEQEVEAENTEADSNENDEAQPAQEEQPASSKEDEDFKRKFERISGKMSSVEKARNQAESENEALRKQLAKAEARLAVREEMQNLPPNRDSQPSTVDDESSSNTSSDDWFLSTSNGDDIPADTRSNPTPPKPKSKANSKDSNPASDIDIDSRVEAALAQRDKQRRQADFSDKMDVVLTELGDKATFVELVNEPDFDAFVSGSRSRLAVFNDAAQHQDDESVKMMTNIVADYLGRDKNSQKDKEKPKPKPTPEVKKQGQKMQKPKPKQVSYEQYLKAVKDKRHPSKRKAANKVIDAWEKQNE